MNAKNPPQKTTMQTGAEAYMITRLHDMRCFGKILKALIVMMPFNTYHTYSSFDERP